MSGNQQTRLDSGSGSGTGGDDGDTSSDERDETDATTPTDQEPQESLGGTSGGGGGGDSTESAQTDSTTETADAPDRPATEQTGPALDPGTVDYSAAETEEQRPKRPATQGKGPALDPSGPNAPNPYIPDEVDPTRGEAVEGTEPVTIADDETLREQFAQQHEELDADEIVLTDVGGEAAFQITDPQFSNKPIPASQIESRVASQLDVDEDEIQVREEDDGGFEFTANATDLYARQRRSAAAEMDVDPRDIVVKQTDDGVRFDVVSEVEREMAAEQFQEQRQDVAEELGVEPRDIDVVREDDDVVFRPDRDAQEEILEERIREEEPDAENIEFEQDNGDLRATYEVDESPDIDDVVGGVKDPVGAAKSIGSGVVEGVDPRNNKAVAAGGALFATPEPVSTGTGAVIIGAGALAGIGHELTKDETRVGTATASSAASPYVDEVEVPESREEYDVVEMPVDEGIVIEEQGEIPVEGRPEDTRSEIETPEEQTPPPEIERPRREDLIESGEAEIPIMDQAELLVEEQQRQEDESGTDPVIEEQTVITGEEVLHPEEMRRRLEQGEQEQEFEEIDEEEVVTITSEDLVDPEELHQEREEELAQQLEEHEQYLQEQGEEAASGESGETEDVDDELQPLQERGEDEFEGRQGELFTFIGGQELELEDELEMEEVAQEQASLLEEAQSTSVETGADQLLPPADDLGAETPTEGVSEQAQETAVDQLLEELAMQEQALDAELATDLATETATVESNALVNEFAFEEGYGQSRRRLYLPDMPDMDGGGDAAAAPGDGSDARFTWDVQESRNLDTDVDFSGVDDLDDF